MKEVSSDKTQSNAAKQHSLVNINENTSAPLLRESVDSYEVTDVQNENAIREAGAVQYEGKITRWNKRARIVAAPATLRACRFLLIPRAGAERSVTCSGRNAFVVCRSLLIQRCEALGARVRPGAARNESVCVKVREEVVLVAKQTHLPRRSGQGVGDDARL